MNIILASSSSYRRTLLERLSLPFEHASPNIDESALPGEQPEALSLRLSQDKAKALSVAHPDSLIIGSDQVAVLNQQTGEKLVLGKPGTEEQAFLQLKQASGQTVNFLTGLCLLHPEHKKTQTACIPYTVQFRNLSDSEIERYIYHDQPLDCAGSFKWEALGISLLERMSGDDPTALEGLPLITLSRFLRNLDYPCP